MMFGHHIQDEVIAMPINQPKHSYDYRGHTELSTAEKGAPAIAAALLQKTAVQFTRFVSLYHTVAGMSHCCADHPIAFLVTTTLSMIRFVLSLRDQRKLTRSADYKGQITLLLHGCLAYIKIISRSRRLPIGQGATQATSCK